MEKNKGLSGKNAAGCQSDISGLGLQGALQLSLSLKCACTFYFHFILSEEPEHTSIKYSHNKEAECQKAHPSIFTLLIEHYVICPAKARG